MVLQWPTDGAEAAAMSTNSCWLMRPAAISSRAFHTAMPEPQRSPFHQPFSIGPPESTIDGDVHGRGRHDAGRRGLVAAGHQHDAVERIAVEDLDEAQIGEVAVERRGRALAGLLDRMHRKFERDAAGRADAFAHAARELEVMAVAGREVGAGLRDADDRLAGAQFLRRQPEVHVALEIERRHAGIFRVVEPELRAQVLAPRVRRLRQFLAFFLAMSSLPRSARLEWFDFAARMR